MTIIASILVIMDKEKHREFKIYCIRKDISMSKMIEELIDNEMNNNAKR